MSGRKDAWYAAKVTQLDYQWLTKAADKSRKRGGAKRAALYCIGGEYVNAEQLAKRLGVPKEKALRRIQAAKAKPGAVTWERLGVAL